MIGLQTFANLMLRHLLGRNAARLAQPARMELLWDALTIYQTHK